MNVKRPEDIFEHANLPQFDGRSINGTLVAEGSADENDKLGEN